MRKRRLLIWLYLLNAAVLITHEIDSAYWHEWKMFGLPGGIQVFLVINLALVGMVLYGLQALAGGRPLGILFSWLLVACGLFAVGIHARFLLGGSEAFRLPVSLVLLAATLVISLIQGIGLWRRR